MTAGGGHGARLVTMPGDEPTEDVSPRPPEDQRKGQAEQERRRAELMRLVVQIAREPLPAVLSATGAKLVASYDVGNKEIWYATDLGLVNCAWLKSGRYVVDLTLWHDVRDVELRVEIASIADGSSLAIDYYLRVQLPRLVANSGSERFGEFCRAVVRLASGRTIESP
jgi:hypothetical protein